MTTHTATTEIARDGEATEPTPAAAASESKDTSDSTGADATKPVVSEETAAVTGSAEEKKE